MKIGLALSGGVARGIAHIGVLKYLEEREIELSFLAGTSAGSIMAGLYCAGIPLIDMEKIALAFSWKDLFKLTLPRFGLVDSFLLEKLVEEYIGRIDFSELKTPLLVNAVDLVQGEEIIIDSGPVVTAIRASCAIPGIFTPVKLKEMLLADGGVLNNVPAKPLKDKGMDRVIAVDLNAQKPLLETPQNIFEVLIQSYEIIQRNQRQASHAYVDLLIEPDLGDISVWDIGKGALMIERGYEACRRALEGTGTLLSRRGLFKRFGRKLRRS
jgi:NTE family protein